MNAVSVMPDDAVHDDEACAVLRELVQVSQDLVYSTESLASLGLDQAALARSISSAMHQHHQQLHCQDFRRTDAGGAGGQFLS